MTNEEALSILHCPDTVGGLYSKKYGEALNMAMGALKKEPCEDCVSRQAVLSDIQSNWDWETVDGITATTVLKQVMTDITNAPSVTPTSPKSEWIPVKWHEVAKEETEHENCMSWIDYPLQGEEHWLIFENPMPENEQEILVCMVGDYIEVDRAFKDDEYGWGLDIHDWEDVLAWMPLPEPYKAESEVEDGKTNEI